jgi:uncharacterized membrane protein (UPF0127 family)
MSVLVNGKRFNAEYMTTSEELSKGMMGRDSMNGCMVFKMAKRGFHHFWMKNCKIPLDMVFILHDRISKIHHNCPPCEGDCTETYTGPADHIIEFPGGTAKDWKVGDQVTMYLGSPMNPA